MVVSPPLWLRFVTLLAINLLYLMVWGFAGISKIRDGMPAWFPEKFGGTILAKVPGFTATFWLLTASELAVLALALAALLRGEFLGRRGPGFLLVTLAGSLLVFLELGFGQWLTNEFTGAFQQFVYFGLTLLAMHTVLAFAPVSSATRR